MGQIQNAFLQSLGAFSQVAQMYRLTDRYAKGKAKEELDKRLKELEQQEQSSKVQVETLADIRQKGFTEEQNKAFQEKYSNLAAAPELAKEKKVNVTNTVNALKKAGIGEDNPKYADAIAEQEWLRLNYPSSKDLKMFQEANESSPLHESYALSLKKKYGEDVFVKKAKQKMKNITKGGTV